jgi:hypothetical protein
MGGSRAGVVKLEIRHTADGRAFELLIFEGGNTHTSILAPTFPDLLGIVVDQLTGHFVPEDQWKHCIDADSDVAALFCPACEEMVLCERHRGA